MLPAEELQKIAFIGNYLPRKCGIATFTRDICTAIQTAYPRADCFVASVEDIPGAYDYPSEVRFRFPEGDLAGYSRTANFLNLTDADVVCLQHEYGIYGGEAGRHVLTLLRDLRMPIITTLHTILEEPKDDQRRVMTDLAELSTRLVVMSRKGRAMLEGIYGVPARKIDLIPHGIPDMPFTDTSFFKDQYGVEGKQVILTFGLLSPNKGIEYMLRALPRIVERFSDVVYIVLGATHPHLVRTEGEAYRRRLEALAKELGVAEHVQFFNQFVELDQLKEFIGAADVYVTPYLNRAQITSGTLAYSFGCGKAVVSTPYWHAEELLDEGRGILVPMQDDQAIADSVLELLADDNRRNAMRKRAYLLGRKMIWSEVAAGYMDSFQRARRACMETGIEVTTETDTPPIAAVSKDSSGACEVAGKAISMGAGQTDPPIDSWIDAAPPMDTAIGPAHAACAVVAPSVAALPYSVAPIIPQPRFDHLARMTDSTGLFQHAVYGVPNFLEGYCTDDNARALVLCVLLEELGMDTSQTRSAASVYAAFVHFAFDPEYRHFHNFLSFDRRWLDDMGSEDSMGRAIWALGACVGRSRQRSLQYWAAGLFDKAIVSAMDATSPRAWAFALLGIHEYLRRLDGDRMVDTLRDELTARLVHAYKENASEEWPWFEEIVAYSNAKLPHALLLSGRWANNVEAMEIGLKTLRWIIDIQRSPGGHFRPIGSNGFYPRGGSRAEFDQQPIEAYCVVSACIEAYRGTGDEIWLHEARNAFAWFLGRNDHGLPLCDLATGACYDGLHADRINQNQGAESTLAYLLASAEMKLMESPGDVGALSPQGMDGISDTAGERHRPIRKKRKRRNHELV